MNISRKFKPFLRKMESAGIPDIAIANFRHYYQQLLSGNTGVMCREEIDPVDTVPDYQELKGYESAGRDALPHCVIFKLNGGLGTSMGMDRAKSLLPVKQAHSFLDIIIQQVLIQRKKSGIRLPLIFMNSPNTRMDTLNHLSMYADVNAGLPLDFIQSRVPKVRQDDFTPVHHPGNPELEWCPPGHGDIYTSLVTSGILEELLNKGFRYAFISNSDNLGAVMDEQILGYIAAHDFPFLMEVAERTPADCKGGHLARLKNGRLTLREVAQCPESELPEFQDIQLYRYFNTNTIWIDLQVLDRILRTREYFLDLPLIRNAKPVDPQIPDSTPVYQLETAMGAALSLFPGATALRVTRERFMPVKTCQDLIGLWSDAYCLTEDFHLKLDSVTPEPVISVLDPQHYKMVHQLRSRFPHGAPSLRECTRWEVQGDVTFGRNITLKGNVVISNKTGRPQTLPDHTVIVDRVYAF